MFIALPQALAKRLPNARGYATANHTSTSTPNERWKYVPQSGTYPKGFHVGRTHVIFFHKNQIPGLGSCSRVTLGGKEEAINTR